MVLLQCGRCPLCGEGAEMEVSETLAIRILDWETRGKPTSVQLEFPELTAGQREMLISGSHDQCFDEAFSE